MKIRCLTSTPFYIIEQFCNRYTNLVQSGMGYSIFCPDSERRPAIRFNTRLYSCQYIRNDIPFRWRGRYNEDTDLSLRILKAGYCTAEFNAFLIEKRATQTMIGGNTDEFYAKEGTYKKSKMLEEMHPDVVYLTKKFNRWHHHVNYKPFKDIILKFKDGLKLNDKINNYGLIYLSDNIPYTVEMLATIFNRKINIIKLALKTFIEFNMISIEDDIIKVLNWEKHQNIDGMEKIREQNKIRQQKHREKQKTISNVTSRDSNGTDKIRIDKNRLDKDIYKESDKQIDEIYNMYPSKCKERKQSTGKSHRHKDKIKRLIKKVGYDTLKETIKLYLKESEKNKTWIKNFDTFLNNLPDISQFTADERLDQFGRVITEDNAF